MDQQKREEALQELKHELDEAVKAQKHVLAVRGNLKSVGYLFDNDIDLLLECSVEEPGSDNWPLGAVISLGGKYGGYLYVDNRLPDGELQIDYDKQ